MKPDLRKNNCLNINCYGKYKGINRIKINNIPKAENNICHLNAAFKGNTE